MRLVADDDFIAGTGQHLEGDLVCHRAARHEQGRLLAEQLGDLLLQQIDRWVLAILVIADRRGGHERRMPSEGNVTVSDRRSTRSMTYLCGEASRHNIGDPRAMR